MKLFYSPTSPFVRKVMACAIARGIEGRIETVRANPHDSPPDLLEANPLSKVPCLVTDEGLALFDSPVICEFLDSVGDAAKLFPPSGPARWRALKQQALGDGILDAAVGRRGEMAKPVEAARQAWMARQKAAISRALAQIEADPPQSGLDIGTITLACALGYLDFRFGAEPWRGAHPRLADWFGAIAAHPAIAGTVPKEG
ncbi:MAG TPA: glutathione S-transferase N-terminal domain-containing protein [Acetobacteraceae bacterium]|nr:glutathione S-transferase N-terminal domain-containing protein [Acetobacteraceae bacterium]